MKDCFAMFMAVALLWFGRGCDRPGGDHVSPEKSGPQVSTQQEDSVGRLNELASQLYGKQVTVNGALVRRHSEAGGEQEGYYTLEDRGPLRNRITVLTRAPIVTGGTPLVEDAHVIVTGTLRQLTPELEGELGWQLSVGLKEDLRGKPVLFATEVRRLDPPAARWHDPRAAG